MTELIVTTPALSSAMKIAALSRSFDEANAHRDGEAVTWGRLAKVAEEAGEVIAAFIGTTGQNPRKGVTHSLADVGEELLDVAITALCALEHLSEEPGLCLEHLDAKVERVYERAGRPPLNPPEGKQ